MTKQEGKIMTKPSQASSYKRIWIESFDEEDWQQLFLQDLNEGYEGGKIFLRAN